MKMTLPFCLLFQLYKCCTRVHRSNNRISTANHQFFLFCFAKCPVFKSNWITFDVFRSDVDENMLEFHEMLRIVIRQNMMLA